MTQPPPLPVKVSKDDAINRYSDGWRAGKPAEDPDKLKRWGWVSAKPSEVLIRMRRGAVMSAGQGATIFKWPWDSVSIVPTTVQRLNFVADQITQEKVGVRVTGIAMYRIADPLIAFRMLNFSFPERAQEKLSVMMEELCVGAVRRLVANLSVEHCLTRRKDALATELVREIAPVVSGQGRVDDKTDKGWGLVVDTIEIQDVRVLSSAVFANMQARFRHENERAAREAELTMQRSIKQSETTTEREVELSRVASAIEVRRQKQIAEEEGKLEKLASDARVEEQRLAREAEMRQRKQAAEEQALREKIDADRRLALAKQAADEESALNQLAASLRLEQEKLRGEVEAAKLAVEAEQMRHAARLAEAQQAQVLAEAKRVLTDIETKTVELEVRKQQLYGSLEIDRAANLKQIENTVSEEAIQLAIANKLPELAQAFQQKMGEVHVTSIDGANPFGYVAAAVEGVMGLARSAGLKMPSKPE